MARDPKRNLSAIVQIVILIKEVDAKTERRYDSFNVRGIDSA
jgi:hypothetical protein